VVPRRSAALDLVAGPRCDGDGAFPPSRFIAIAGPATLDRCLVGRRYTVDDAGASVETERIEVEAAFAHVV
jgi:hypothetical protein